MPSFEREKLLRIVHLRSLDVLALSLTPAQLDSRRCAKKRTRPNFSPRVIQAAIMVRGDSFNREISFEKAKIQFANLKAAT